MSLNINWSRWSAALGGLIRRKIRRKSCLDWLATSRHYPLYALYLRRHQSRCKMLPLLEIQGHHTWQEPTARLIGIILQSYYCPEDLVSCLPHGYPLLSTSDSIGFTIIIRAGLAYTNNTKSCGCGNVCHHELHFTASFEAVSLMCPGYSHITPILVKEWLDSICSRLM